MTQRPYLAAVVVNWQDYAITADCLASVFASTYRPLTVIVVDNESAPERLGDLQARFPDVVYLPQQSNLGCGLGRNCGIEKALELGAEIISFVDDDSLITPGYFEEIVQVATSAAAIGIVGAVNIVDGESELIYVAGAQWYDWLGYDRWLHFGVPYAKLRKYGGAFEAVDVVNGAGLTVKREVVEKIGKFHPLLSPYGPEDVEFCLRARDRGFRVVLARHARLIHRVSGRLRERSWSRMAGQAECYWALLGVLRPLRYAPTSIATHIARQVLWETRAIRSGRWFVAGQIAKMNVVGAWRLVSGKYRTYGPRLRRGGST